MSRNVRKFLLFGKKRWRKLKVFRQTFSRCLFDKSFLRPYRPNIWQSWCAFWWIFQALFCHESPTMYDILAIQRTLFYHLSDLNGAILWLDNDQPGRDSSKPLIFSPEEVNKVTQLNESRFSPVFGEKLELKKLLQAKILNIVILKDKKNLKFDRHFFQEILPIWQLWNCHVIFVSP